MTTQTQTKRGFTIIEVVLVLAIAALIFLMIFVALPALQRNQRDTARKNDVGVVVSSVAAFVSATRDNLTSSDSTDFRGYIDELDQYDVDDVVVRASLGAQEDRDEQLIVIPGMKCDGNSVVDGSRRTAAVVAVLENNGSNPIDYCQSA